MRTTNLQRPKVSRREDTQEIHMFVAEFIHSHGIDVVVHSIGAPGVTMHAGTCAICDWKVPAAYQAGQLCADPTLMHQPQTCYARDASADEKEGILLYMRSQVPGITN